MCCSLADFWKIQLTWSRRKSYNTIVSKIEQASGFENICEMLGHNGFITTRARSLRWELEIESLAKSQMVRQITTMHNNCQWWILKYECLTQRCDLDKNKRSVVMNCEFKWCLLRTWTHVPVNMHCTMVVTVRLPEMSTGTSGLMCWSKYRCICETKGCRMSSSTTFMHWMSAVGICRDLRYGRHGCACTGTWLLGFMELNRATPGTVNTRGEILFVKICVATMNRFVS